MDQATLKKIADLIDTAAEALNQVGAAFRGAGGNSGGKAVAGKAKGKPAAKSAADEEITEDSLREALSELSGLKGKEVMLWALDYVGCTKLAEVDEDDYQSLMDKIAELKDAEDGAEEKPAKIKAKAKAKKPEPPDAEEVTAAFKKLLKADKVAAKKVLKAVGLAAIDDLDEDDEEQVQELADAIAAAE